MERHKASDLIVFVSCGAVISYTVVFQSKPQCGNIKFWGSWRGGRLSSQPTCPNVAALLPFQCNVESSVLSNLSRSASSLRARTPDFQLIQDLKAIHTHAMLAHDFIWKTLSCLDGKCSWTPTEM